MPARPTFTFETGPEVIQLPGTVTPRSRTRVRLHRPAMALVGAEQDTFAEFPNWDRDRPPVVYELQIWHRYDGSFKFWIKDADNDPDSLRSIADTLRRAANWIDPDFVEIIASK